MTTIKNSTFSEFAGVAAPAVAPAGSGRIYFDAATGTFKQSQNAGPYLDLGILQELIYRPTDPAPTGNVYADWATLVAAAALIPGNKVVFLDDSLAPIDIPAGAWDFGSYTVLAAITQSPISAMPVTIEDGATFANVYEFENLSIDSLSTTFVVDVPAAISPTYILRGNCQINQTGTGTFFQLASAQRMAVYFRDISAFGGGTCVNVLVAGAFVFLVGAEIGRVDADTCVSVAGSLVRGLVFGAGVNFQTAQAGLPGGLMSLFILPRSTAVTYDDSLVLPSLNLLTNLLQEAIDTLKSKPIDSWKFSGVLLGGVGASSGFAADPGPEISVVQAAILYRRGSVSGNVEIYLRVLTNSLTTDANFTLFLAGAPTAVTILVPAGVFGQFQTAAPIPLVLAIGDEIDLEVDTAAGGVGNSISFSADVRFLP